MRKTLTTPIASNANKTVPKNNGNCVISPPANFPVVLIGPLKI